MNRNKSKLLTNYYVQAVFAGLLCLCVLPLAAARAGYQVPGLARLAASPLCPALLAAPLYTAAGPWLLGHVLSDQLGMVFVWGTVLLPPSPAYLPTATSWLYGCHHLATVQLPLILALALALNTARSAVRHLPLLLLALYQAWLAQGFYLAYGWLACLLGPLRIGHLAVLLACWVWVARTSQADRARLDLVIPTHK